ncbi:MAG: ATP-binding protein [Halieaceae bacterium]|nr:ATP-binding protein [Halieaceae bacterium]
MSDISCRVFEFFETGAAHYGYTLEQLVDGIDIELEVLQEPSNRVPWPVWSQICERFEVLAGGPECSLEWGRTIIDLDDASTPTRAIGGALVNTDLVYVAVARWLGPYFFRSHEWRVERLQPGHIILEINMPEPVSPAWWRMAEGSFIAIPLAFGGKPAQVNARIDGGFGRFEIRREASTTLWARTIARIRAAFAAPALLEELAVLQADLRSALVEANESQREMHRALSAVPEPVALIKGGKAIWRNDAWIRSLGPEIPPQVTLAVGAGADIGGDEPFEVHLQNDSIYEVVPPVEISYEGVPAAMVMLRDVTQARSAGERLRVADRLASLGTLAASIGHEINNPLQVALGSLDLAERDLDGAADDAELRSNLESATDGIRRAAAITSDLLSFGREDATSDVLQMANMVDTALRLAGNELRHIGSIRVTIDPQLPTVRGNAGRLIQVIVNLLINAAQAMRECPDREHCIEIEGIPYGRQVRLQIRDTGPGVPPELLRRIREPFFSTKGQGGSGLGLAVCESIMKDHGGSIEISNLADGGAQFELRLPMSACHLELAPAPPVDGMALEPSKRILLVDDEPMIATLIQAQLAPCDVVACQNEASAMEAIKGNGHFDAVLLDVMLLEGSGLDVARRLPAELQERVIFMTGGVFEGEMLAELSDRPNPVLPKPFTQGKLLEVLGEVTG